MSQFTLMLTAKQLSCCTKKKKVRNLVNQTFYTKFSIQIIIAVYTKEIFCPTKINPKLYNNNNNIHYTRLLNNGLSQVCL